MAAKFGPLTLMPIGARIPVCNMIRRVSIGCNLGAEVMPGNCVTLVISSQMSSGDWMWSRHCRKYWPLRSSSSSPFLSRRYFPWASTLNRRRWPSSSVLYSDLYKITFSYMGKGAGSSALSTRPALPTTVSTSGMAVTAMSSMRRLRAFSCVPAWGMALGMRRKDPSSSAGINS